MKQKKTDFLALVYILVVMAICFPMALYYVAMFFYAHKILDFVIGFSAILVGVIFTFLTIMREKGYKFKYFFSRKNFKFLVAKSLVKFNLKNYKFAQVFTKTRKPIYYQTGRIFYKEEVFGEEYRDPQIKQKIIVLYSLLLKNIREETGFEGFFDDVLVADVESNFQAYYYMCNDSISKELQFIIMEVYKMTDFGFLEEKTEQEIRYNIKTRAVLEHIFNPLLFNFESELENVILKLTNMEVEE